MKYVLAFVFGIFFCGATAAQSDESTEESSNFFEEYRLEDVFNRMEQGAIDERHYVIIYNILKNTNEHHIHQQRGHTGNNTYLHKDGHKEAVYDAEGNLVQDGMNDGSFNFRHPYEEPLLHFLADIHPWIKWGQSPEDPTSVDERIFAYVADLGDGIQRAHAQRNDLIEPTIDDPSQLGTFAIFLKFIEAGEAESLFVIFDQESINVEELRDILRSIQRGMNSVYYGM